MSDLSKREASSTKHQLPLQEGLFTLPSSPSEKGHLIGNRCRSCGSTFFPKSFRCLNCTGAELDEVLLSPRGKLDAFTTVRAAPPGTIMKIPYILAQVELPEGPIVKTVLPDDCAPETLELGMDMELVIEKVKEDEAGNDIMAYKFRPVKS